MAETRFAGEPLRVLRARVARARTAARRAPGTLLGIADDGLHVACGDGRARGARAAARRQAAGVRARFRERHAPRRHCGSAHETHRNRTPQPAAAPRAPCARRGNARRTRRSRCTPSSTRDVPPTSRWKPRTSAPIARRCARSRSARCAGICASRPRSRRSSTGRSMNSSPQLAALLVTAAHQVEYSRGAAEAQVHLAVDASRVVGEGRASGVVNAVLRRFVGAARASCWRPSMRIPAQRHAHPRWLRGCGDRGMGRSARSRSCGQQPASAHGAARRSRAVARRRISCARGARWAARRTRSSGTTPPSCSSGRSPCRRCRGSMRVRVSVQDAARSSPRRCSMRKPACACWMPALRRAARRCTSRSARPISPS